MMNDLINAMKVNDRKTATAVLLINWSKFQNVRIALDGSTLITGVNGTGKSTILDAMTYLLTGNKRFNIAAGDKDRSVKAYVRGDTQSEGEHRYLRSGNVTSYVAMEFFSPIDGFFIVAGVCIESMNEQECKPGAWFIMKDARLKDFEFCYIKDGKFHTHSRSNLLFKGRRLKSKDFRGEGNGTEALLRALGLRCETAKYRSKLVKMMAFNPETDIDKFIRDAVLDPGKVSSLAELKEQKQQFEEIKRVYNELEAGRKQLQVIEERTGEYEKRKDIAELRELVYAYQNIPITGDKLHKNEQQLDRLKLELKELEDEKELLLQEESHAVERYSAASHNDLLSGMKETIDVLSGQVRELAYSIKDRNTEVSKLKRLEEQLRDTVGYLPLDDETKDVLTSLSGTGYGSEEKQSAVLKAKALYEDYSDRLNTEYVHLKDEKTGLEGELNEIRIRISSLEKERIVYPKEAERAKEVIKREFDKRGIKGEVRFFCELVAEITDPSWQKAVETFLGNKRFNIIVDEKNCYTAMQILKETRLYHSRVVMTDRLPETEITEGSAAGLLTIPNRAARNYANYLLNGIHLCKDLNELHDHPKGGITADGMLAKSYSVTLMDLRKTVPCMGRDAVKAQLKQAGRELEDICKKLDKCASEYKDTEKRRKSLADIRLNAQEYDFASPHTLKSLNDDKAVKEREIEKIRRDPSFAAALEEQAAAEEELKKVRTKQDNNAKRIGANNNHTSTLNESITALMREIAVFKDEYEVRIREHEEMRSRVEQEYLRLKKDHGEAVSYQNLNTVQNDMKRACDVMEQAQLEYCHITGTDTLRRGPSFIPYYRKELRDTSNVKIEEVKEQLNLKSKELESAFMIDFVGEINESILKADEEMNLINSELRKLPFGNDTYKFVKKEKPDRAMFFRIKRKLHDYMDKPEVYMSSNRDDEEMEQYIREYMDIIIEEENEDEYTDYRKYFTYDMVITSKQGEETVEANLSKKQGSASNGEKQTPYFIILAASLMQFYHEKCCERLAFIDEAFSALSGERIDQMVKYLEENHFQVIYAAPPEKIGSIGEHVSSTVSLVLTGRHTQAVEGIIR